MKENKELIEEKINENTEKKTKIIKNMKFSIKLEIIGMIILLIFKYLIGESSIIDYLFNLLKNFVMADLIFATFMIYFYDHKNLKLEDELEDNTYSK